MILKKDLLTEYEKKKILRKAIMFFGRACFGWVGMSTANQHFLKVGLIVIVVIRINLIKHNIA